MVKHCSILLVLATFLFSCKSDEDKSNPEIQVQNIEWPSGAFNDQDTLLVQAGEELVISTLLQDDQNLNSFKLKLDAVTLNAIHQEESSWSVSRITPVTGTSESLVNTLNAPAQADGFFTLDLNLIDDQGNSATPVEFVINVENTELPVIQIDSLNSSIPSSTIQLLAGQSFVIKGSASDNTVLENLSLNWLFGNVIFTTNEFSLNSNAISLEDFEFTAPIDLTGDVDFYLSFRDGDQNVKNCAFSATISE